MTDDLNAMQSAACTLLVKPKPTRCPSSILFISSAVVDPAGYERTTVLRIVVMEHIQLHLEHSSSSSIIWLTPTPKWLWRLT
jgi:hypothetical protein